MRINKSSFSLFLYKKKNCKRCLTDSDILKINFVYTIVVRRGKRRKSLFTFEYYIVLSIIFTKGTNETTKSRFS